MKISKIEFENFRNFKEHGEIKCSTDGKVTIIYGLNGDGKTTLHQLFQWIFYGTVNFNKTTNNHLYNLQFEQEQPYMSVFNVEGCIEFEHDGAQYSAKRVNVYRKGLKDSERISEDFSISKMNENYDWRRLEKPAEIVEKLLPSGLSDYFFFDGESMIADLRVKGKDSANKLRKALFSMFDMDIIEAAISHIGKTDLKTTVLGQLYLDKGSASSGDIAATKTNIETSQNKIEEYNNKLDILTIKKKELNDLIQEVSEQIGAYKSKAEYEKQRKILKAQRDSFLKSALDAQRHFGDDIFDMFPRLLISKAVSDAKKKIHLKVEDDKLPPGLSKKLINYLLSSSTEKCICGNCLGEKERIQIDAYFKMMPPKSYSSLYQDFSKTAKDWGKGYDKARIEDYIETVLDNNELAENADKQIHELDESEKNSPDMEDLIVKRQQAEIDILAIESYISEAQIQIKKYQLYRDKQMKVFDTLTRENIESQKVQKKIEIMQKVAEYFRNELDNASIEYSKLLQDNIQNLIDKMLTSKRNVHVSPEFSVRVIDSFNDESKSEGQFAVVSFAYIGGILQMLKNTKGLASKEYPLVLDGPFSKLDKEQRKNVVDCLPQFAPQVILFSKDNLQNVFEKENIGRVWTIESNDEKNVAVVKEGFLWK